MNASQCFAQIQEIIRNGSGRDTDVIEVIQKALDEAAKTKPEHSVHTLKSWPAAYAPVVENRKRHEYRLNDRNYKEGDDLVLQEWDPSSRNYTGRSCRVRCLYISYGPQWGIPDNYAVISISDPYDIKDSRDAG